MADFEREIRMVPAYDKRAEGYGLHLVEVRLYPAQWDLHGKGAGFRRNEQMAAECEAVVAALYVDPRGVYADMPGVDPWDVERDARLYAGPDPVVAHPPCGPWGKLAHMCRYQDPSLAVCAVAQVRRWGGVLEHPEASRLWRRCRLPFPGEFPDEHGGYTIAVRQCDWGHVCAKPTWLYIVGTRELPPMPPPGTPTHKLTNSDRPWTVGLRRASAEQRRRTPPAFAQWLISIAWSARIAEAAE